MMKQLIEDIVRALVDQPGEVQIKEIGTEASQTTRTYPVTLVMNQPEDFLERRMDWIIDAKQHAALEKRLAALGLRNSCK